MKFANYQIGANEVLRSATYHDGKLNHITCYWPHFYGGETVTYYLKGKKWVSVHHCDDEVMGVGQKKEDVQIGLDWPMKVQIPMEIPDGGWYCADTGRQYGRKLWMDNTGTIQGLGKPAQAATV